MITLKNNTKNASFIFEYKGIVKIDWGDNTLEFIKTQNVAHVYEDSRVRVVTVYATPSDILLFAAPYKNGVLEIDVSKATNLIRLAVGNNSITMLDVSANTQINRVEVPGNPIVTNDANLATLAESLPDRRGKGAGVLAIVNSAQAEKITNIVTPKNWIAT